MNPIRFSGRRRLLALAAAAVALLTLPLGVASAAAAQPQPVARYVALGDSYAAGQGTGDYLDLACFQSTEGYPALLDATPRISLLRDSSCSGSTIAEVAATQLGQLNRGTTLVTITAGANDLGIAQVYAACAADMTSPGCQQAIAVARSTIPTVGPAMAGLIAAVQARSPEARIVVTGYPLPFSGVYAQAVYLADVVDQATTALDAQLAGAVQLSAGAGSTVRFATVSFGDHAIGGASEPWIGGDVTVPVDFLHPTAAGYLAYRDAILATLG
ncbi:SGNH/GDSL hydrolase family protein [Microbacterium sp. 22242]|uniref:SGNH/GDSL hydrolase family protein n=1 Tax=Microbacterium sp. 22242 TaxID=3453896 RepID=UPI003F83CD01